MQRVASGVNKATSPDGPFYALQLLQSRLDDLEQDEKRVNNLFSTHNKAIDETIIQDLYGQLNTLSGYTKTSLATCLSLEKQRSCSKKAKDQMLVDICVNDYLSNKIHRTFDGILHAYQIPCAKEKQWPEPIRHISKGQAMLLIVEQFQQLHTVAQQLQQLVRQRGYSVKNPMYYITLKACCAAQQEYINSCTTYAAKQFRFVAESQMDIPSLTYMLIQRHTVHHYYKMYRDCNEDPMSWMGLD